MTSKEFFEKYPYITEINYAPHWVGSRIKISGIRTDIGVEQLIEKTKFFEDFKQLSFWIADNTPKIGDFKITITNTSKNLQDLFNDIS